MNKFAALIIGDVIRLWRYKITFFGLLVSAIWIVLLILVNEQEANALLPQLLMLDSGLMTIILLGASYFYEKQEGTMKAVLVTPTSPALLLLAKVVAIMVGSIISLILMWLTVGFIHGNFFSLLPAFGILLLATLAHISLGFILIYWSQDFMDLLLKYTFMVLLLLVPNILVSFSIIGENLQWIALISPTFAGQRLLQSLWTPIESNQFLISGLFLLIYPLGLFPFYILPKFRQEAMSA